MQRQTAAFFTTIGLVSLFGTGCGSSLAAPFDRMKGTPMTVYRLQNYEPPAAQAAAPGLASPFPVPPEIQKWMGQGASMIPPGLLPPGLIPGLSPAPAPAQDVARFHGFRILGWMAINDEKQREELTDIFGKDKNFETPKQNCMYAELGFSFGNAVTAPGQPPPLDMLVSLSCHQVQAFNFAWPHGAKTAPTQDAENRVVALWRRAFGG